MKKIILTVLLILFIDTIVLSKQTKDEEEIWELYLDKKYFSAEEKITKFLEYDPSNVFILLIWGRILVDTEKPYLALSPLRKAVAFDKSESWKKAWALAYIGKAYLALNRPDEAREVLILCYKMQATVNSANLASELLVENGWEVPSQDLEKDLDYFKEKLPKKHSNLFFKLSENSFFDEIEVLRSDIDSLTKLQFAFRLQQIIAKVGDSHSSSISFKLMRKTFPIKLYWFKDGFYVVKTVIDHKELLGKKLIGINIHSVENVLDRLKTIIPAENEIILRKRGAKHIRYFDVLKFLNIADSEEVEFIFLDFMKKSMKVTLKASDDTGPEKLSIKPAVLSLPFKNPKNRFWFEYLEDNKVLYVKYNECMSRETALRNGKVSKSQASFIPSFNEFSDEVLRLIKTKDIEKVVVDMRHNQGGSTWPGEKLITKLSKNEKINQRGKLYIIIGQDTYSAAIRNAISFKQKTKAILVGEPTAGKPNRYGRTRSFVLPESGLRINYSTKYFSPDPEDPTSLMPDILVETSIHDYMNGEDPVLSRIIN